MSQDIFERELTRRAEDVQGARFSFEDVRGKAVSIRRKRRAAVAGGVAAAVALVVLVPTVLGGGSPKSQAPEPAPSPPGNTAVLHDGTLTLPGGDTVELDPTGAAASQVAVLTDGRIVVSLQEPDLVRVYGPDGTLQKEHRALESSLTTSADDSLVTWIGGPGGMVDRGVRVLPSGQETPTIFPGIPAAGEYSGLVNAVLAPDRLLVDGLGFTSSVLTPGGAEDLPNPESFTVTDVSPDGGLWTVQYYPPRGDPQFGCAGLYDPLAETVVAENCETSWLRFSPDGQHLVGVRGDNSMWSEAKVFDLDLELVGRWESPGGGDVIKAVAWEDADHLLVSEVNWQDQTWALTRVDLTWSDREVLEGPVLGGNPELVNEFVLSE